MRGPIKRTYWAHNPSIVHKRIRINGNKFEICMIPSDLFICTMYLVLRRLVLIKGQ